MVMNVDIETYSDADLTKTGVYAYAASSAFEILLIGYSLDNGPVEVIDLTEYTDLGLWEDPEKRLYELRELFPEFTDNLLNPECLKTAYNANFERTCLAAYLKTPMPPEQWRCTAVHAATLGLPGTLGSVGEALGLPEDKQKDKIGKQLIRYFCRPCEPTKVNKGRTRNLPEHDPDKWKLFIEYNRQDVVTEKAIRDRITKYEVPDSEQNLWNLDQEMNDRGILIDMDLVNNILAFDEVYQKNLLTEAKILTGLDNPNSLAQLKRWLKNEHGIEADSITKDTLPELMDRFKDDPSGLRVMQIRAELGKTSTKKYTAMKKAVCPDNRLRGILQFYGANRTGRWAGRIVQVHNLPQNKIPDIGLARQLAKDGDFQFMQDIFDEGIPFIFSQLVRTAFIPSERCTFVVADFSAIEARVIAWLAGEEWTLQAFRQGKDIYCETASQMYHVPVEKHGRNAHLRQKGKIAVLACGYQGGVGAMKAMDKSGTIPEKEMQSVVNQWRQANPHVVKLWHDYEEAAKTAIRERRKVIRRIRTAAGKREGAPPVEFSYINRNLFIKLPSGRNLCYWNAKAEEQSDGREHITYGSVNQMSRKWERQETYGGKLVENVVQATARDCLAVAMTRVTQAGYKIVMHVHDEMICDVPEATEKDLEVILSIMKKPIPWAPGLPLKGDGYLTPFYRKD